MIDNKILQERIKAILDFCKDTKRLPWGTPEQKLAYKSLWDTIKALDDEAKSKLGENPVMPGRFIKWPVKDGYARYIVCME